MKHRRQLLVAVGIAAAMLGAQFSGCAPPFPPRDTPPPPPAENVEAPNAEAPTLKQVGEASWYGPAQDGKETASGDTFDQHKLTAAHRTLPLGTKAVVTNLENGKSVEVTINDRGPYAKGRKTDLSHAAAQQIGMSKQGVAKVKIEASPHRRTTKPRTTKRVPVVETTNSDPPAPTAR